MRDHTDIMILDESSVIEFNSYLRNLEVAVPPLLHYLRDSPLHRTNQVDYRSRVFSSAHSETSPLLDLNIVYVPLYVPDYEEMKRRPYSHTVGSRAWCANLLIAPESAHKRQEDYLAPALHWVHYDFQIESLWGSMDVDENKARDETLPIQQIFNPRIHFIPHMTSIS